MPASEQLRAHSSLNPHLTLACYHDISADCCLAGGGEGRGRRRAVAQVQILLRKATFSKTNKHKTKAKYQEKGYNLFTLIVSISIWKIFDAIYAHIISWRGQAYGISAQVGDVSIKVVIIFYHKEM